MIKRLVQLALLLASFLAGYVAGHEDLLPFLSDILPSAGAATAQGAGGPPVNPAPKGLVRGGARPTGRETRNRASFRYGGDPAVLHAEPDREDAEGPRSSGAEERERRRIERSVEAPARRDRGSEPAAADPALSTDVRGAARVLHPPAAPPCRRARAPGRSSSTCKARARA